jgi:hypothetical protein
MHIWNEEGFQYSRSSSCRNPRVMNYLCKNKMLSLYGFGRWPVSRIVSPFKQSRYFFISALIKYTFMELYGILQKKSIEEGGYHENRLGSRRATQGRHPGAHLQFRQNPDLPQGPWGSEEDPDGHFGRTQRHEHREDLQTLRVQNQKILLRYPTVRSRQRHRCPDAQENRSENRPQAHNRTGKKGHPAAPQYQQGYVQANEATQSRGLRCWPSLSRTNFERLWHQQKKIPEQEIKERSRALLMPETVAVLDGALKSKRIEVTRQSLQAELETALRRGVTTSHAGGFFFIPYLMELGLYGALGELSPPKTTGIPTAKIALQLIWEPIFGYVKGIRSVDPISQADFGLLSGLPFICSVSTEYRFLVESTIERSEAFQKHLGKRLLHLDYLKGEVLNMDGHSIKLYSRKEMKSSYLTKEQSYGKAIRTFYTQDQTSKKPVFIKAAYSGTSVAQVTPQLVEANKAILGRSFLSVNDKEWFVGSLLDQLDKIHGIEVLLPLKRTPKRIREMEAIPFEKFKGRYQNHPIATLVTELDEFSGKMKLFVKQNADGTFFALITNKKYFRATRAMEIYHRRWRIENFFNENGFLGIDRLPSLELNAIQTALTLKMVSFHLVDNFRRNLPGPFATMKPESIYQMFINGVQGKIQLRKNKLHIDIYGFQHRDVVAPLFQGLEKKLAAQNIDPRCPWLNDYALGFSFK